MPVIGLRHRGNPNNMVVDGSNRMIVVSEMGRRFRIQRDDFGKMSIHTQSSRSKFTVGLANESAAKGGTVNLLYQVLALFILALPIASIAWTITHEEVLREFRDICVGKSATCRSIYERKFFYLFTCEYCFSHYVTAIFLFITRYKLLFADWRGYLIAGFSLVWVANVYMSAFGRLRLDLTRERLEIKSEESKVETGS